MSSGPLAATLDGAGLRWIRWHGIEVLRALMLTVRDRSWRTIEPEIIEIKQRQRSTVASLSFSARYPVDDPFLDVEVRITAASTGVIEFAMRGEARRHFIRNRIGIIALHPGSVAGRAVRFVGSDGPRAGTFPRHVAPWVVATDLKAIEWSPTRGVQANLVLAGDLFEMEDQRNWSDASFKTYPTPLRLPIPVAVPAGEVIVQSAVLHIQGTPRRRMTSTPDAIRVTDRVRARLPSIGALLPPQAPALSDADAAHLRSVGIPHVRAIVDAQDPQATLQLGQAVQDAARASTLLELDLLVSTAEGAVLARLLDRVAEDQHRFAALFVFDRRSRSGFDTTADVVSAVRDGLAKRGLRVPVGGGTRANFTELNRAGLAGSHLDLITFAVNPQVHAFDEASIIETLDILPLLARESRAIVNDRPLSIVLTLKPRFTVTTDRDQQAADNPDRIDQRQGSLFAAAWLVGAIAALSQRGVERLSCFEAVGPAGLMSATGSQFSVAPAKAAMQPVGVVVSALTRAAGSPVLSVQEPRGTAVLAIRRRSRLDVLIANLEPLAKSVQIVLPVRAHFGAAALDGSSAPDGIHAGWNMRPSMDFDGLLPSTVHLGPWGVVRLKERLLVSGEGRT